jgi:hypothetical protein
MPFRFPQTMPSMIIHRARARLISLPVFYASIALLGLALYLQRDAAVSVPESGSGLGRFLWPLALYLFAHLARFARLGVLLNANCLRKLLALHFYTAACSILIPLKLGELVRINELAWWTGNFWRGLLIVWVERIFDVVALALMILFLLFETGIELRALRLLLLAIGAFIFLSLLVFFILPEQLFSLNLHVIRSYKGRKAVRILRVVDTAYDFLQQFRLLVAGKITTLSLLTALVWGLELAAMSLLFGNEHLVRGIHSLLTQFSDLLSTAPTASGRLDRLSLDFYLLKALALGTVGLAALSFYIGWRRGQAPGRGAAC